VAVNPHSALEPVTFKLRLSGDSSAELAVELRFYGLLDRVMPYYAQEQIGVALLKGACNAGPTKRALETAVATARALVFEMGSTTPWLTEAFQDLRYVITDRVVNGSPVWAVEGGKNFMYRVGDGTMMIGTEAACAVGRLRGSIHNTVHSPDVVAPTQLPSNKWRSSKLATLGPQFAAAGGTDENRWVDVPDMRVTAVHGLDDDEPAKAAALRQVAALTAAE